MSDLVLSQEMYNMAVANKKLNDDTLVELYAAYSTMPFNEKLIAMELVSNIKAISDEYDKYIVIYQQKIKEGKRKTAYLVVEGDTLHRIADKFTGDFNNWIAIYEYNNLTDIILTPGDEIQIPEGL